MAQGAGIGKARRARVVELRLGGAKNKDIARALKVSDAVVCETLKRDDVVAQLAEADRACFDLITARRGAIAVEAMEGLVQLMRGCPDPATGKARGYDEIPASVRKSAMTDLLDRCGVTKETAITITSESRHHLTVEFRGVPVIDDELTTLDAELADLPPDPGLRLLT